MQKMLMNRIISDQHGSECLNLIISSPSNRLFNTRHRFYYITVHGSEPRENPESKRKKIHSYIITHFPRWRASSHHLNQKPMNSTALPLPNRSLCFQTSYIAFCRPAVCSSTALISSGTSPGPSPHCWRRQQRYEEVSDVRFGLMNPSSEQMVMMW